MKIFGKDHRGQCFQPKVAEKMKEPEFYSTWIQPSLSALTSLPALIKSSSLFSSLLFLNAFFEISPENQHTKSHQNKPWTYLCLPFSFPHFIQGLDYPSAKTPGAGASKTATVLLPALLPPQPWEARIEDAAIKCGKGAQGQGNSYHDHAVATVISTPYLSSRPKGL